MKKVLSISILIAALVGGVIFYAHAQTATIDLSLSTLPLDPQPLQQVTITAQSFSTDLSQASLVWSYNGKTVSNSIGQTSITVTAPASGTTATISIAASGNDFSLTTASLVLRPASVDLLWEGADSYTPPFYEGRALPSTGGVIRVVAIPTISAPRNLSYNWTQNDDAQQTSSGYNKTSFTFRNDPLISTENIAVSEASGNFSGSSSTTITPSDPTVLGYFNTNGFIDYANGSTNLLSTNSTGAIVHFEPYYFSVPHSIKNDLTFSYTDNDGDSLTTGDTPNELPLSRPDGGGQSLFTIAISTSAYSLQNISRLFNVTFN